MTTYTLNGYFEIEEAYGFSQFGRADLEFVVQEGDSASFTYTNETGVDWEGDQYIYSTVAGAENTIVRLNGEEWLDLDSLFLQVEWGNGQETWLMLLTSDDYDTSEVIDWFIELGGDAFPVFRSGAEFDAFEEQVGDVGEITTGAYRPGVEIRFADFAGVEITEDDLFVGGMDADTFRAGIGNDTIIGNGGDDMIDAGDGVDRIEGGDGNDTIIGGTSINDLRDVVFGGDGNDSIDGGYGNDELRGDAGNDQIAGGFGADTVIGGAGDDTMTGSAFGDLIIGGAGSDFVNGGFGSDRVNGGADADTFYHLGIRDHGSDWIQDFDGVGDQDYLFFGGTATIDQFQVNVANTANAGEDSIAEAFVIYRPAGQILWALVDGASHDTVSLRIGNQFFDLEV